MKKRILAMVMVVMMTVAYLPAMAFAEETPQGGGQQNISQMVTDRQVEFLNMVLPLIQGLKLNEKAELLGELREKISELQRTTGEALDDKLSEIQSLMESINEISKASGEDLLSVLKFFAPEPYSQITLITIFENWMATRDLSDGEVKEMRLALTEYKDTLIALKDAIDTYLQGYKSADDDAREELIKGINDAMTSMGNALHNLESSFVYVLAGTADQIRADAQAYSDFLKEQISLIAKGVVTATPKSVAQATETLNKLRDTMTLLQSVVKASQPFITAKLNEVVSQAVSQAQGALKTGGVALQSFITKVVQTISGSQGTPGNNQGTPGNGTKGNSDVSSKFSTMYLSQLQNAAKIVNIKPSLKSLTSKGKKVSVKWAAVKAGKISYYQVSYQQKGKKAVTKTFKKYKAAAKFITYKSKKLKKGKKYTFKVRGVYKMTAAAAGTKSKAARFYTQWSKSRTIKVK